MMIKKNDELIGIVESFGSNGEGIVKEDGMVIFIPFALPKEKVKYKVLKVGKGYAYGKVLEVIEKSPERSIPVCSAFGKCGGCQLQHVEYFSQLKLKEENVKTCFKKIAFLDVDVESAVACQKAFNYRNKLQLPVEEVGGKTIIGFYAENSHRVVEIDDCPINPTWTKDIISAFKSYVQEFNLKGYNNLTFTGDIREITVKEVNKKLIIAMVVTSLKIRGVGRLIEILRESLDFEFSLYLNENKTRSNVIYGDKFALKYGKGEYEGDLFGIKYPVGVRSFTQVNDEVCYKLYSEVKKQIKSDADTVVIDAYSGAGLMTALLSLDAKRAVGIEVVKEAVDCADKLKENNNLTEKITNYCGKCEELLPLVIEKEKMGGEKLAIVLDPPRKGCDVKVLEAVKNSGADKIVYVSCMPSSLARDVGILVGTLEASENGIKKVEKANSVYQVTLIKPFDMFPQTKHVETIVCLDKR